MTEDPRELSFDDGPKRIESIRWTQENLILTRDPLALGPDTDTLTMSPNPGVLVCKPVCLGIPLTPRAAPLSGIYSLEDNPTPCSL
jgi:hypothetical protein